MRRYIHIAVAVIGIVIKAWLGQGAEPRPAVTVVKIEIHIVR